MKGWYKIDRLSIIQIVSSPVWGGREQHVRDLSQGLVKNGHRVTIVTRNHPAIIRFYEPVADTVILPLRNLVDIFSIFKLALLIKTRKVDIIHTHAGRDAWIALFATKLAGRGKVFNSRHTVSSVKNDILHRWYYSSLAKVICVSNLVRNEFLAACSIIDPKKATVVYNGIDTQKFTGAADGAMRGELGITDDFIIGYAGRVSGEKGLEYLIEAGSILQKKGYNFKIVIVGQAKEDYLAFLQGRVSEFNLVDKVVFCGFREDVSTFMRDIDVFVLPCVWQEAFGLVLCEAMVCGKPVITTDGGAQAELITHGIDGFIVPRWSAKHIADTVEQLIVDPGFAHSVGARAKNTVLERFSLNHMVNAIERCYRGIF